MRVLADENCGSMLLSALTGAGHDVKAVARIEPGIADVDVFALAKQEDRILLTHDTGFGHIAELADARPPAITLMRLREVRAALRAKIVVRAITDLGGSLSGHFVVVGPTSVRMRPYKN